MGRVGIIVKKRWFLLSRCPVLSLGLWVQHQLSLLQGPMLRFIGREVWGMALSSVPWAVDIVCGMAVVWPRTFVVKACVGAVSRALDAARQYSKGGKPFWEHKYYKTWMWGNTTVRTCYKLVIRVLVSENLYWTDYFCCGITVWRNCYWHVHMWTESWYSEMNQLMESAARIVLKQWA